jgi:hypothetical protein
VEKVIDKVVFVATFWAPVDGVEDVTWNPTSDATDAADATDAGGVADVLDEERCEAGALAVRDGAE